MDATEPAPDRDSGSMRLVGLMRLLVARGHRLAFMPDDFRRTAAGQEVLHRLGAAYPPVASPAEAMRWIKRHADSIRVVILGRHHVASAWLPAVRRLAPHAKIIFDSVDVHFLRETRQAEIEGRAALHRMARRTRRLELAVVHAADGTWVVSPAEQELLRSLCPRADVGIVSNIIEADSAGRPFRERSGLLFVGSFRHPPNVDALQWFARTVMPLLQQQLPGLVVHVVGAGMPNALASELSSWPSLRIHGHVPDIEPMLTGCRIGIAPLRFGAGVKGKVNSSMAHGQPVVATTCAVEGMNLRSGMDVLTADTPEDFAAAIVRLNLDEALWSRLSEGGRQNVRRNFSPAAAMTAVTAMIPEPANH